MPRRRALPLLLVLLAALGMSSQPAPARVAPAQAARPYTIESTGSSKWGDVATGSVTTKNLSYGSVENGYISRWRVKWRPYLRLLRDQRQGPLVGRTRSLEAR